MSALNKIPVQASRLVQEKQTAKSVYKQQSDVEKKTIDVNVTEVPGKLLVLPLQAVQFSTQLFASATQSPLIAAQQVRDLVCRGIDYTKTYELNIINNIPWPPRLPNEIKNFSFKRSVMKLAHSVRERVLKKLYESLTAPLKAFYNQITEIKKKFLDTIDNIKSLFTCNRD